MRTLIPPAVTAPAQPRTRAARLLGFALTPRALTLLLAGLLLAIPAFFHPRAIWAMFAWDAIVLTLALIEAVSLPSPSALTVTRRFLESPRLGELTRVELELTQTSNALLEVTLTDDLAPTLLPTPHPLRVLAYPRDPIRATLEIYPGQRGDQTLGAVFLRYRTRLKLAERWAIAPLTQQIRVFPARTQGEATSSLHLMRARQIELQKRRLRQRGMGREFESLRDYQSGDELRNLSWTATARRGKLITRQFTMERSQQVWVVLDAGRLSRTAFVLARSTRALQQETELEAADSLRLTVTQLDQATTAAFLLAETVAVSGDKCGLLTYGRTIQQQLLPSTGPAHQRAYLDQLSQTHTEPAEANHLAAASRLKQLQRRRGLIIWITELADSATRPEVVAAAAELTRRHLVLLVLLEHPELATLATTAPQTTQQMYASAAAQELLTRRRETIATLRRQGVLVVQTTPGEIATRAINAYLDIKARNLL